MMQSIPVFTCTDDGRHTLSVFACEERDEYSVLDQDGDLVGRIYIRNDCLVGELFDEPVYQMYPFREQHLHDSLGHIEAFAPVMEEIYSAYIERVKYIHSGV